MSLIVGIIAKGGIILASDSRTSNSHSLNDTADKIFALSDGFAIGIVGDSMLGKHVLDALNPDNIDYKKGIQTVVEQIRAVFAEMFDRYFPGTPCYERVSLQLILACYNNDSGKTPYLYVFDSEDNFVPRQTQLGYQCVGTPYISNYILARIYDQDKMIVKHAAKLSIFCIRETSFQVTGVGGKIKVGILKPDNKFELLPNHEVKKMLDQGKNLQYFHKSKFYPEDLGGSEL